MKPDKAPKGLYYAYLILMTISMVGSVFFGVNVISYMFSTRDIFRQSIGGFFTHNIQFTVYLILSVICIISVIVFNRLQLSLRDKVEYDRFGQARKRDFTHLSKQERLRIEEQKMMLQESAISSTELDSITHKGSSDPDSDISNLIGLSSVKKLIRDYEAQFMYDRKFGQTHQERPSYHMCFSGPPGTGKTTVARIMTGILYKNRIIRKNRYVETDGNTFHGETPAQAEQKLKRILRQADGGVLFIDEAYALDTGTSSQETIATLIKAMEDERENLVVILAGYTDEMTRLISSNPGFSSRIQIYIKFPSYSLQELREIFTKLVQKEGFEVTQIALDAFEASIEPETRSRYFGNGRTVRNYVQAAMLRHKKNCAVLLQNGSLDEERRKTIESCDIIKPHTL